MRERTHTTSPTVAIDKARLKSQVSSDSCPHNLVTVCKSCDLRRSSKPNVQPSGSTPKTRNDEKTPSTSTAQDDPSSIASSSKCSIDFLLCAPTSSNHASTPATAKGKERETSHTSSSSVKDRASTSFANTSAVSATGASKEKR